MPLLSPFDQATHTPLAFVSRVDDADRGDDLNWTGLGGDDLNWTGLGGVIWIGQVLLCKAEISRSPNKAICLLLMSKSCLLIFALTNHFLLQDFTIVQICFYSINFCLKVKTDKIYIACEMKACSIKSDTMFQLWLWRVHDCDVYMNLCKVTL